MNIINILLLIQMGILFTFPLLRRLIGGSAQNQKQHHNFFSLINMFVSVTVLVLVLYYGSNYETSVVLFSIDNLSFSLGFSVSILRTIFYTVIVICLTIYLNYLAVEKQDLSKSTLDHLPYFAMLIIPFVFSPNFFQLIVVWFILDILYLEYLNSLSKDSRLENRLGFKQLFFSLIIANTLIITSFILLITRTASFNYAIIVNDIQLKFFIHNQYFLLLNILFFVGVIAKISIFPFHTWFRNANRDNLSWNIPVISFYIFTNLFTFINTPYFKLLPVLVDTFAWVGITVAIISITIAVFTNNRSSLLVLILSSLFAYILFTFGSGNYAIGFHTMITMIIVGTAIPIIITNRSKEEPTDEVGKTKPQLFTKIIFFLTTAIIFLGLIGVPPLNSSILGIIIVFASQSNSLSLALFIIGFLFLFQLGIIGIKLAYDLWSKRAERKSVRNVILVAVLTITLILTFAIYPYFHIIDLFETPIAIETPILLVSALPLGISFLLAIVSFVLLKTIFTEFNDLMDPYLLNIEKTYQKIYYYDFLYSPLEVLYFKLLLPSIKWFHRYFIKAFLVGVIFTVLARISTCFWKTLKNFIVEVAIPKIKSFFIVLSKTIRKFESASDKSQLIYVLLSIVLLLLLTFFLFIGGVIV
ncbi:MAG: hypothetical protein ACTSQ4_07815 [Candidatus Heimdallarchaeaceae archaeon]